jgi:hypothetical protein
MNEPNLAKARNLRENRNSSLILLMMAITSRSTCYLILLREVYIGKQEALYVHNKV